MPNPYLTAWRRQQRNRRAAEGPARLAGAALSLAAFAAGGWLIKPALFGWLAHPGSLAWGAEQVGVRLALLACGFMCVTTYSNLVRGVDRPVLDPHPVDPAQLLTYLLARTAQESWLLPVGLAVLSLPVAIEGSWAAWGLIVGGVLGGWFAGLMAGFPAHLLAVWMVDSPSLAWILDALRGQNSRLNSATIYSPGLAMILASPGLFGAITIQEALSGQPALALALLAPLVFGAAIWTTARPLARRFHHRTTTLLAEIDALDASVQLVDDAEEARRVYMEWAIRFAPSRLRPELLKELRHGWRGLRGWVNANWGVGALAFLAGCSDEPTAATVVAAVAAGGMLATASIGVRLASTDPEWLDRVLPVPPSQRLAARALAIFLWLQTALLVALLALTIRQGPNWALIAAFEALALVAALLSALASRWRARGWALYVPVAVLLWAGFANGAGVSI